MLNTSRAPPNGYILMTTCYSNTFKIRASFTEIDIGMDIKQGRESHTNPFRSYISIKSIASTAASRTADSGSFSARYFILGSASDAAGPMPARPSTAAQRW